MTEPTKSKPVVVLPPPIFSLSPLSNRYQLIYQLKWGSFEKNITVDQELFTFPQDLAKAFNEALVEGAESSPYILS